MLGKAGAITRRIVESRRTSGNMSICVRSHVSSGSAENVADCHSRCQRTCRTNICMYIHSYTRHHIGLVTRQTSPPPLPPNADPPTRQIRIDTPYHDTRIPHRQSADPSRVLCGKRLTVDVCVCVCLSKTCRHIDAVTSSESMIIVCPIECVYFGTDIPLFSEFAIIR